MGNRLAKRLSFHQSHCCGARTGILRRPKLDRDTTSDKGLRQPFRQQFSFCQAANFLKCSAARSAVFDNPRAHLGESQLQQLPEDPRSGAFSGFRSASNEDSSGVCHSRTAFSIPFAVAAGRCPTSGGV
jgi:hypothetical protein